MEKRPKIAQSYIPLREAILSDNALESRAKTLAYLAASYANESPHDVAAFHSVALQQGFSEDDVRALRTEQDHSFAPLEHAAIRIARELTRTCTMDDIETDEVNLFTSEQLVELVAVVSLANFDNRFSNALDIEPEAKADAVRAADSSGAAN